jgi:phosphatidate cytidylyltransferase
MGRSLWEMDRMLKPGVKFGLILAAAGCLILLGDAYLYHGGNLGPMMVLIVVAQLIYMTVMYPYYSPVDGAATLLGTLYVGLLVYIYLLRTLEGGWTWISFMLAGTWASDTAAYFTGRLLGRHRLSPALSPGKTVEGALGGLAGSTLAAGVYYRVDPFAPLHRLLILGFLVGLAAVFGDLVESAFKRQAGVKDASDLIPGHGGMLDRFDSMLFTAPLVYYFARVFNIF